MRIALNPPLSEIEDVARIVDTRDPEADNYFQNAASCDPPFGYAVHVTDDPSAILSVLKKGRKLHKSYGRASPEFGMGGLFASAVPQVWMSRSAKKWNFLSNLTKRQKNELVQAILVTLRDQRKVGYITQNEYDYAKRDLFHYLDGLLGEYSVVRVAEQPYNIRVWEQKFLKSLGIEQGVEPIQVPVVFVGRYSLMSTTPPKPSTMRILRKHIDGAFYRDSMGTDAQILIWNSKAVVQFGDWKNPRFK